MPLVTSGVENGNLRELALARMKDFGTTCRDVRTREVGVNEIKNKIRPNQIELVRRDYTANGGWETFLAYEDPKQDILVALLRLRKCTEKYTYRRSLSANRPAWYASSMCTARRCLSTHAIHGNSSIRGSAPC